MMILNATRLLMLLILVIWGSILHADTVSLKVSPGISATAEYLTGDPDKPLLLFIHGFMQTRNFSTVKRLSESLNDENYPILAPTFSLGISNRVQPMPCESFHLHSLDEETDEISKWVNWAVQKGHKEIVLIGHSSGSINITAFLAKSSHSAITKTILISLTPYDLHGQVIPDAIESRPVPNNQPSNTEEGLQMYALQICKEYLSTRQDFLSYYNWNSEKIINSIITSKTKNFIILGDADDRIGAKWLSELKRVSDIIITIKGANHFFDQAHEFDLLESVEEILTAH